MRASRLLRILLMLQNRGRMSTLELSRELEVARRTVIRDIDALAEAGLPVVAHRGNAGGVELAFNYRSHLVGLDAAESEALGVLLAQPKPLLADLGMEAAAESACAKLAEAMSDVVRLRIREARERFRFPASASKRGGAGDSRIPALAQAVRQSAIVRLEATSSSPRTIHPVGLEYRGSGWTVIDGLDPKRPIPAARWGDVNISARRFR